MSQDADKAAELSTGILAPMPAHAGSAAAPRGFLGWPHVWTLTLSTAALAAMIATTLSGKGHFIAAVGVLVALVAAWFDSATNRVPNALTYPTILIGLALNALAAGALAANVPALGLWLAPTSASPLVESLLGFGACTVIGVVCLLVGGIGMGDFKFIAGLGALFGLHTVCTMLLWALVVAIPLAIANLLADRKLQQFFQAFGLHLMNWFWMRKHEPVLEVSAKRIAVALPIAAGVILGLAVPRGMLPLWLTGGAA